MLKVNLDDLTPRLREAINSELDEGESLLWADKPVQKHYSRESMNPAWILPVLAVCFGLILTLEATFVPPHDLQQRPHHRVNEAGELVYPQRPARAFWSLGVSAGVVCVTSVYARIADRRRASRLAFALTDRRLIRVQIVSGDRISIEDFGGEDLRRTKRTEFADGVGSLWMHDLPGSTSTARRSTVVQAVRSEEHTSELQSH